MAKSETVVSVDRVAKELPAAYVPFKTFLSAVESLEHGIPKIIDRTIWRNQSGVVQSQIMMALRFFDLVNAEDRPTQALHRFVAEKENRKGFIQSLLLHAYHNLIEHDLTKMTPKMLDDLMESYHVSGETKRKAVTFFLQAAKFAEIPMHPLLYGQIRNTGPRKKRVRREEHAESNGDAMSQENSHAKKDVKSLELQSGGSLTLSMNVDIFALSQSDRDFVFGLIDKFHEYEKSRNVT